MPWAEAAEGASAAKLRAAAAISPRVNLRSIVVLQCWREAVVSSLPICRAVFAVRSNAGERFVFPECFVGVRAEVLVNGRGVNPAFILKDVIGRAMTNVKTSADAFPKTQLCLP